MPPDLDELDAVTRAQLLEGDWQVRPEGVMFKREWFAVVEQRTRQGQPRALLGQGGHRGRRRAHRRRAHRPHRPRSSTTSRMWSVASGRL